MSKLTRDDVLKLARLSRLRLTDEEVVQFTEEFNDILGYIEQLDQVNTDGLMPTSQVTGLKNVTRPDVEREYQAQPSALLANAPATQDGMFKVKRVL